MIVIGVETHAHTAKYTMSHTIYVTNTHWACTNKDCRMNIVLYRIKIGIPFCAIDSIEKNFQHAIWTKSMREKPNKIRKIDKNKISWFRYSLSSSKWIITKTGSMKCCWPRIHMASLDKVLFVNYNMF